MTNGTRIPPSAVYALRFKIGLPVEALAHSGPSDTLEFALPKFSVEFIEVMSGPSSTQITDIFAGEDPVASGPLSARYIM